MRSKILALVLASLSFAAHSQDIKKLVDDYLNLNGVQVLNRYRALLAIPNVASDLPNITKNADYIKSRFEAAGVEMKLLTLPDTPPIVYGYIPAEGATKTIAFYVHYDGQPVDKSQWSNDPWQATYYSEAMFNGGEVIDFPRVAQDIKPDHRIYARSASDDKAPIISLLTALDVMKVNGLAATSNIVFFFEGEEEAGSAKLRQYLQENRSLIDPIDVWLFCDGPTHQSRKPQLVFGVRGVTGMEVTVYGASRPLHSGHYGNWAPVPGQMLAQLVASMKDAEGNVLIEGFYDDVEPLKRSEKKALGAVPAIDEQLKQELAVADPEGTEPYSERLLLPSLTIRGLSSGNTGALARNVVPATATVSIGLRLVKGVDPEKQKDLVEAHIKKQGYHIVREVPDIETRRQYPKIALITRGGGYPAARTSMDTPIAKSIINRAKTVAGEDLVLLPTLGGSLPLYLFTDMLDKPAIIVPIANYDNNQHAADENIRIGNLWYGIKLMTALMTME